MYFLTHGNSTEQNCQILSQMHRRAEEWTSTHGSKFDLTKYRMIHLTGSPRKYDMKQALRLPRATIQPEATVRYLGGIIVPPLRWSHNIQHIQAKATTTLAAIRSLQGAGFTWGSGLIELRQLYQPLVTPGHIWMLGKVDTARREGSHGENARRREPDTA
jgi:hypothetical protein